jgi:uncharacterized protein (TIGR01777 family)
MSNNANFDWSGKRVVITGATGLIGGTVARMLMERGADVIVFSRDPSAARKTLPGAADYVAWQPEIPTKETVWVKAIDGAYAVVHCAAPSLFGKRLSEAGVREMQHNRVTSTRGLVAAMAMVASKPAVFVSSASQGIYGFPKQITEQRMDESAPAGDDFWGQDSIPWEQAALEAKKLGVRTVVMRTGYVLDADGQGGLAQQVAQHQKGWGAAVTPVDSWVSWIHIEDEARLYVFALEDERVQGPLNGTAPEPVTQRDFANALSMAVNGKPTNRTFPGFFLQLSMGKPAEIIRYGRRVVPKKALELGFTFHCPTIDKALADLVPKIAAK